MNNIEYHGDEWLKQEQKLKAEVVEVSESVRVLLEDVTFTMIEMFKIDPRISGNETPSEKKIIMKQIMVLLSRLRINVEELTKVDRRHEALKLKVAKFYNLSPDILPSEHLTDHFITIDQIKEVIQEWKNACKEMESGDEWKNSI